MQTIMEGSSIETWVKASLSDSNVIRTHNHLVRKWTLNHLACYLHVICLKHVVSTQPCYLQNNTIKASIFYSTQPALPAHS